MFKALEIAYKLVIDVLITPLSILLICEISAPISFASCSCVIFYSHGQLGYVLQVLIEIFYFLDFSHTKIALKQNIIYKQICLYLIFFLYLIYYLNFSFDEN